MHYKYNRTYLVSYSSIIKICDVCDWTYFPEIILMLIENINMLYHFESFSLKQLLPSSPVCVLTLLCGLLSFSTPNEFICSSLFSSPSSIILDDDGLLQLFLRANSLLLLLFVLFSDVAPC